MTGKELCGKLSIDAKQLAAWVKEGLPWTGSNRRRSFDPEAVRAWLVTAGKAEPLAPPKPTIVRTVGEVAREFEVTPKTVFEWLRKGMPGTPGPRGRQEGTFPLEEIRSWLGRQPAGTIAAGEESEQQKLARARRQLLELELSEKRGTLVEAEQFARALVRHIHEVKTQFDQLPATILKLLPASVPADVRARIRKRIKRLLAQNYATLELSLRAESESDLDQPEDQKRGESER